MIFSLGDVSDIRYSSYRNIGLFTLDISDFTPLTNILETKRVAEEQINRRIHFNTEQSTKSTT